MPKHKTHPAQIRFAQLGGVHKNTQTDIQRNLKTQQAGGRLSENSPPPSTLKMEEKTV